MSYNLSYTSNDKACYSHDCISHDKKLKIEKVSRDCAIKSKETRIRLWDKRTFWA